MFDKLVESNKPTDRGRTGRLFFLTGAFYAVLLSALAVWTILGFGATLAEELSLTTVLTPHVPPGAPPIQKMVVQKAAPAATIFSPPTADRPIPIPTEVPPTTNRTEIGPIVPGAPNFSNEGGNNPAGARFVPGGIEKGEPPPPPPPVKVKPTPEPEPAPTPQRTLTKVSEGVIKGLAIRKVHPQYSAIAKSAHAQGPVQIQVLISEEGRVINADVLSGHPLLRQLALEAARQWVFKPTLLSNVPVKVQGVLTFNFTLN